MSRLPQEAHKEIVPAPPSGRRLAILSRSAGDDLFLRTAIPHLRQPNTAVLLSAGSAESGRYSYAAWNARLVFTTKNGMCSVTDSAQVRKSRAQPLKLMDQILAAGRPDMISSFPFSGGLIGYFAYELKNRLEKLPQSAEDDLGLPDAFLFMPADILVHDRAERTLSHIEMRWPDGPGRSDRPVYQTSENERPGFLRAGKPKSNFSREEYLEAVERIRDYIERGEVYQVNLSQRLSFPLDGDPVAYWLRMLELNPAPYFACINAGDHWIASTSMELFLRREADGIITRPIKGTRPRGGNRAEDARLRRQLLGSAKDEAELSMIVDLLRNDLNRVCATGSVRVADHKRMDAYQNVFHLSSEIQGRLPPGATAGQILGATFPGGSITGCPKIRAMQIIDELEPVVRHAYTGAIGYLGWHDTMQLSVAIRTAIVSGGLCHFGVGGGIVYDSDAESEYLETLHKARTLIDAARPTPESK